MKSCPRSAIACFHPIHRVSRCPSGAHPRKATGARFTGPALVALLGIASLFVHAKSDAAVTFLSIRADLDPNYVEMDLTASNTIQGAEFNSALLNLTIPLAEGLLDLPGNQGKSIPDLIADWSATVLPPPSGQVHNGWNGTFNNDGSLTLNNNGGKNVDTWFASQDNPDQNTTYLTLRIPKSQLEFDGIPGYDPLTDASIVLSSQTMPNAFVGVQDSLNQYATDGQFYQVQIPEPSTYAAFFGSLALGLALIRRKQRAEPASR